MLYYLYALFTSPGVVIHELGHAVFCILGRIKIHRVCLFRFGNPAGFVVHDEPKYFYQSIFISYGPLIVNSLLALFCFARVIPSFNRAEPWLFLWLGGAIGLHAIPSTGDAHTLLQTTNHRIWKNPLLLIGYPFILLLYILNWLKRLHIDIVYVGILFWVSTVYLRT